ncbi:hypothetical protein AAHN93_05150 [Vandammella animalimorsus]
MEDWEPVDWEPVDWEPVDWEPEALALGAAVPVAVALAQVQEA